MEKYKKTYLISSFQVDSFSRLRIRSLFNLFQDVADEQAELIGVGYSFCKQNGIGWVGGAYHLKINRLPTWGDKITIETWPSDATAASAIRDFRVLDSQGQVLISATSQWVLVDTVRMRPIPLAKHLPHYEILDERAIKSDFSKIQVPEREHQSMLFPVHVDEIDLNRHVNNALYPTWVMDSFEDEFLKEYSPAEIKVMFKRSARRHDKIYLKMYQNGSETISIMENEDHSVEFARVQIVWQKAV